MNEQEQRIMLNEINSYKCQIKNITDLTELEYLLSSILVYIGENNILNDEFQKRVIHYNYYIQKLKQEFEDKKEELGQNLNQIIYLSKPIKDEKTLFSFSYINEVYKDKFDNVENKHYSPNDKQRAENGHILNIKSSLVTVLDELYKVIAEQKTNNIESRSPLSVPNMNKKHKVRYNSDNETFYIDKKELKLSESLSKLLHFYIYNSGLDKNNRKITKQEKYTIINSVKNILGNEKEILIYDYKQKKYTFNSKDFSFYDHRK